MSDLALSLIFLGCFVVAVLLGFFTNINTGLFGLAFSYIIGCFVMQISPSSLIGFWPLKICFVIMMVSMFYNFAGQTGTLEKLALQLLYKFGKQARLFPYLLFIVGWIMSALGAGPYSIIVLLCPLAMVISDKMNMNKMLCCMGVYFGCVAGGGFPTSATGAAGREFISMIGFADTALEYQFYTVFNVLIAFLLFFSILYFFVYKGYKVDVSQVAIEKPEPYTPVQKKILSLIVAFIVVLLLPYVLYLIFPESGIVKLLMAFIDAGFIAAILSIIASLMKLGDGRKALRDCPWNTIIMLTGIGIMVGVAVEAGVVTLLAEAVGRIESPFIVTSLLSIIAGVMSMFSSTSGVVIPTLFPIVYNISMSTGIAGNILLAAVGTGSSFTGMSPLSTCGGLILGTVKEEDSKPIYRQLLIMPLFTLLFTGLLFFVLGLIG